MQTQPLVRPSAASSIGLPPTAYDICADGKGEVLLAHDTDELLQATEAEYAPSARRLEIVLQGGARVPIVVTSDRIAVSLETAPEMTVARGFPERADVAVAMLPIRRVA